MTRRSPDQYNWTTATFDELILAKHFTPATSRQIQYVTLHHMTIIGKGTGSANEACYRTWQNRQASAHYGVDGERVTQFVWDRNVAWSNGNGPSNRVSVAIEHANSTGDPTWRISDTTMRTGARLVATLHRIHRLGRPSRKTVRMHREFKATACPGPYVAAQLAEYIALAQKHYDNPEGDDDMPAGKELFDNVWRDYNLGAWGGDTPWRRPAENPATRLSAVTERSGRALVLGRENAAAIRGLSAALAQIAAKVGVSAEDVQRTITAAVADALKDIEVTLSVDSGDRDA